MSSSLVAERVSFGIGSGSHLLESASLFSSDLLLGQKEHPSQGNGEWRDDKGVDGLTDNG